MKTKTRLTITLSQDLLHRVDALIDGHTIRNRSHAIEQLVKKSLSSKVHTAVILAGGTHSALEIPGLKKINKRPLLAITFEHLKNFGISNFVVCAGTNESAIKAAFGSGSNLGVSIVYSPEKKQLGTAGALKNATKYLEDEPFIVINDATLTNLNLDDFFEFQAREDSVATICVKPRMSESKYGQVYLHGNKITQFMDSSQDQGISIVNIGLYLLKPEILELIPEDTYMNLESDIFPKLAAKKELSAFVFQGSWYDASLKSSLDEAIEEFSQ